MAQCIWHADTDADRIFQLDQSGSIVSSFASPINDPTGIGVDSNDCIWNADSNAIKIYQLTQTGSIVSSFASPSSYPTGVGLGAEIPSLFNFIGEGKIRITGGGTISIL